MSSERAKKGWATRRDRVERMHKLNVMMKMYDIDGEVEATKAVDRQEWPNPYRRAPIFAPHHRYFLKLGPGAFNTARSRTPYETIEGVEEIVNLMIAKRSGTR